MVFVSDVLSLIHTQLPEARSELDKMKPLCYP